MSEEEEQNVNDEGKMNEINKDVHTGEEYKKVVQALSMSNKEQRSPPRSDGESQERDRKRKMTKNFYEHMIKAGSKNVKKSVKGGIGEVIFQRKMKRDGKEFSGTSEEKNDVDFQELVKGDEKEKKNYSSKGDEFEGQKKK